MATFNPMIPLAGQTPKITPWDMGDTMVNIARLRAYEQQRKIDELKYGQAERAASREDEWRQLWGDVLKPQGPAQAGLTGPPQQVPQQAPQMPPQGTSQAQASPYSLADVPAPGGQAGAPTPAAGRQFSQTDFTGPMGMAANIPTNEWMPVNTQTGEWGASPTMPPAPYPNMPPEIQQAAQPPAQGEPSLANPALSFAPPQGPPPGGAAPAGAQGPAPGLAQAQPGLPEMPGLGMPQVNEQAFWRAYAKDPEKTTKAFGDLVKVQGDKLDQVEKTNDVIYNTLLAVEESEDPVTMWPRAIKSLRERGIPVPKDMPEQYDAGLARFMMKQHQGIKMRVEEAKAGYYKAQDIQNRALARKQESEVKTPIERNLEVQQKLATLDKTIAETEDLPKKRALEAERNMLQAIDADLKRDDLELKRTGQQQTAEHQTRTAEQAALGEWNKIALPYKQVRDSMGVVEAAGGKHTPAGDFALVSAYLKMVDEKTGVRDAERRDAENMGGLPAMLKRGEGYIRGKSRLKDDVRQDLMNRTRDMYKSYMSDYDQQMAEYRTIAKNQKLNPDNVVLDFRSTTKRAQEQPQSPKTQATANPASPTIDKEDFMQWRARKGYKGSVNQPEVEAYYKERGGRAG